MATDKEIKKEFKLEASANPQNYYAVDYLKSQGFIRKQCKCGTFFWTVNADQALCGDPACSGGFRFIGDSPAKEELSYIDTWNRFSALFTKLGYTPIKRYPVVARWRKDQYWVGASIYDFQPHVVSGESDPPANPLVVPQYCLRFNDIDNVGITGSHYTGFVMIGQHMFVPKEKWDQNKVFADIHTWLRKGLGLPNSELTFHEDAWAGGGNFGPCMEYFSRGLELGNQVYMLYEQSGSGRRDLPLRVLDMGMGHERNAWFTKGTSTSYETTFPTVSAKLYKIAGIKPEGDLMKKFLPYSSYLNVDEVDDINKTWQKVADNIGIDVSELQDKILPLSALYSVAEHLRSSLVAITDGALPSNVGGGYNLRVILRRAMSFIDKYDWDISVEDVCSWHADYLKPLFPELSESLEDVNKILDIESKKYKSTKVQAKKIVASLLQKGAVSDEKMIELYDSHGISPDMIALEAKAQGKKLRVPEDFYSRLSQLHTQVAPEEKAGTALDLEGLPDTEILYYSDFSLVEFKGIVLKVVGRNVILDKTAFYPTSGGQAHDLGALGGIPVEDIFKQGGIVVHRLSREPGFRKGELVSGKINFERRLQLAQHHTAAHIINGAAKKILGNHVWQAGAHKEVDKARLDITHYDTLTADETSEIEALANTIVNNNIPVYSDLLKRNIAEARFGFRIYQGGAVPGRILRIVRVGEFDAEACGGTHLHLTGEAKKIKILKTSKIQDGIVRIEFTAGKAAADYMEQEYGVLQQAARLIGCEVDQVPFRADELFTKWKKVVKKKKIEGAEDFTLSSTAGYEGDQLEKTAEILHTQQGHIVNTLTRFMDDLKKAEEKWKST